MWLRTEVDATYRELALLALRSLFPFSRPALQSRACEVTGGSHFVFGTSSRSLFSELLQELAWPAGSIVACSAVNIPQMEEIIRLRGLQPHPIDIDARTFSPHLDLVEEIFRSFKPHGYLHASYFGSRPDVSFLRTIAHRWSVFTIDDRAQCFNNLSAPDTWADVTLFSLGPYKSPTAGGGAVALFRDQRLANAIRERLEKLRTEPRYAQLARVLKLLSIKFLSEPLPMQIVSKVLSSSRADYGDFISKRIRQVADIDDVSDKRLSQAPSQALCSCIVTVIGRFSLTRFRRRQQIAQIISENLGSHIRMPGFDSEIHSHWLIPVLSNNPPGLIGVLREAGFDAARMAKTRPIGGSSSEARLCNQVATELLDKLVLVPSDSRMSDTDAKLLGRLVNQYEALNDRSN